MLLPVKTVGVMGDGRTYEYVVGLRAVTSTDGMTADFYPFDMKFLGETATRIINEVKGVNRVVYDVTQQAAGDDRVGMILAHPSVSRQRPRNLRNTLKIKINSSSDFGDYRPAEFGADGPPDGRFAHCEIRFRPIPSR